MKNMSAEEIRVMMDINHKLEAKNLKSRLSRLYIGGLKGGTVTEWEWHEILHDEGAQASIIVSEAIRELFSKG